MASHNSIPEVIEDDIQRTVEHILRSQTEEEGASLNLDPENKRKLLESVCVALQMERNAWKERLQHTLQEIDRQHKAFIVVESSLQDLVTSLGIKPVMESPTSGHRSSDNIQSLQDYISDLQGKIDRMQGNAAMRESIRRLQDQIRILEEEKKQVVEVGSEKTKEISWLQKELNMVRHQMTKLRQIVLNYNQSHSTNFHLEEESVEGRSRSDPLLSRERTYVEGDQLNYFSTTGEEIAVWKLRNKQSREPTGVSSGGSTFRGGGLSRGGGRGASGVTQCLRCNQLFKAAENNSMACRYHKKGRQIREQYDPSGRLLRVLYTWACCKKGLDAPGCTHGCHI